MHVYEAMFRKEFEDLRSFIHFASINTIDTSDKFAKVRTFYDIMNKNLEQFVFCHIFTPLTNKYFTLGRMAASRRSEQRAFALYPKNSCYALQMVTPTSLIHIVVLNMVEEKYKRTFVLYQLLFALLNETIGMIKSFSQ